MSTTITTAEQTANEKPHLRIVNWTEPRAVWGRKRKDGPYEAAMNEIAFIQSRAEHPPTPLSVKSAALMSVRNTVAMRAYFLDMMFDVNCMSVHFPRALTALHDEMTKTLERQQAEIDRMKRQLAR